jgi:hypothetical protein
MPSCCVTFVLPFNDSNEEDGHNSDFENIYKPKEGMELNLNEEILLFKDNNLDSDSKLEDGTSFINIEEYLAEMALIEPPKLPPAKIPVLASNYPIPALKLHAFYNNSIRIQALTLL